MDNSSSRKGKEGNPSKDDHPKVSRAEKRKRAKEMAKAAAVTAAEHQVLRAQKMEAERLRALRDGLRLTDFMEAGTLTPPFGMCGLARCPVE